MENNNNKKKSPASFAVDMEALSKAYADSLKEVNLGDKPVETGSTPKRSAEKSMYTPSDYKPAREASPEHDKIVEKIRQRHRTLSHSVWTDEPVLKPKKSVWLDEGDAKPEPEKEKHSAAAKENITRKTSEPEVQPAPTVTSPVHTDNEEPVIPILAEKRPAVKKEFVMSISDDGCSRVRETPVSRKKQVTISMPDKPRQNRSAGTAQPKKKNDSGVRRTVSISMPVSKQIRDIPPEKPGFEVEIKESQKPEKAEESPKAEQAVKPAAEEKKPEIKTAPEKKERTAESIIEEVMAGRSRSDDLDIPELKNVSTGKRRISVDDEEIDRIISEVTAEFKAVKGIENGEKINSGKTFGTAEKSSQPKADKVRSEVKPQETEKSAVKGKKENGVPADKGADAVKTQKISADENRAAKTGQIKTQPLKGRKDAAAVKYHELEFSFVNGIVCAGFVFVVFFALLFMKRESGFIQSENRNLAEFPSFSVSSWFSGEFADGVTEYFTDTVPGRENFKKFCAEFTSMLGISLNDTVITGNVKNAQKEELDRDKIAATTTVTANTGIASGTTVKTSSSKRTETVEELPENLDDGVWDGNVIISGKGEDVRAMGAYYGSFEVGAQYADTINKWKEEMPDVNVYNMSIPTSAAYYMPANLRDSVSDQKDNIDNIASELKGIINVDVFDSIGEHTEEYIYSRTDHHWQPRGAYYAGQIFAEKAGIEYPGLDTYEEFEIEDFLGTMYGYSNNNQELAENPDTFIYYKPDNSYSVIYYDTAFENPQYGDLFFDYAEGVNCYSAILNVDNEIAQIDTDCDNGRVLVIFKDSFGNALVPFFTHGFSKIYVCDFRYFDLNAIDFCRQVGCTDLLFAISITSCSTPTHITAINNIRIQPNPWEITETTTTTSTTTTTTTTTTAAATTTSAAATASVEEYNDDTQSSAEESVDG